jgi:hypothetical protein
MTRPGSASWVRSTVDALFSIAAVLSDFRTGYGWSMTDDDDVELEDSPLSGELTRDGVTVKVAI